MRHGRKKLHFVAQPTSSFSDSSKSDIKTPHTFRINITRDMNAMEGRFEFGHNTSHAESSVSTLPDFPVPEGWSHESIHTFHDAQVLTEAPVQYLDGLPTLPGIVNRYLTSNHSAQTELERNKKAGKDLVQGPIEERGGYHNFKAFNILSCWQYCTWQENQYISSSSTAINLCRQNRLVSTSQREYPC